MLVRLTRPQRLQVRQGGPGITIIRKDTSGADHHAVFDRHSGANIDERINLDEIPDADAVADVRLFANDAVLPEASAVADVDSVPDGRALADVDVGFNQCSRMNERFHAAAMAEVVVESPAASSPGTAVQASLDRDLYPAWITSTDASASAASMISGSMS